MWWKESSGMAVCGEVVEGLREHGDVEEGCGEDGP